MRSFDPSCNITSLQTPLLANQIQNYSCCGINLPDLHALLEHFEEVHVVVLDSPNLGPTQPPTDNESTNEPQSAFDPDAMDLDSAPSSSAPSPPSTPPVDTAPPTPSAFDNTILRTSRALSKGTISGYNTPRGISPHPHTPGGPAGVSDAGGLGEAAFNPYASYSDFSALMPGTVRTPIHQSPPPLNAIKNGGVGGGDPSSPGANIPTATKCIPPALLFSPSTQTTPTGSPLQSRTGTPTPGAGGSLSRNGSLSGASGFTGGIISACHMSPTSQHSSSGASGIKKPSPTSPIGGASSSGINPLVSKPFRCPTVGCNKSYKQANGLKYHITHGQCNFMPRDPALEGLNENEADEKARPYVCQVGSCTRRYKNMNGLREFPIITNFRLSLAHCFLCFHLRRTGYHYQHSGQHGAVGLALLASGQHSLQTGLKDAGVELPPQVKEQHLLAAQVHQRQLQQPQPPLSPLNTSTTQQSTPQYLSQLQQQQQAAQATLDARAIAEHARQQREQEAMAHVQQRLPAQKTPPLTQLTMPSRAGGMSIVGPGVTYNPSTTRREPETFAMQI